MKILQTMVAVCSMKALFIHMLWLIIMVGT